MTPATLFLLPPLLWLASVLVALVRSKDERLEPGAPFPSIQTKNVHDEAISIPDPAVKWTHVQFLRFSSCPACNLHVRPFVLRAKELEDAGIREVLFFHSEPRLLVEHQGKFPFQVVGDPARIFFRRLGVESSLLATLDPRSWPTLLVGYFLKFSFIPDSSIHGLPADFLVSSTGEVVDCKYGQHAADGWSVDEVLEKTRPATKNRTGTPLRSRVESAFLMISMLFFGGTAWLSGSRPGAFASTLGLSIANPGGLNEVRGQYSGFFLAAALACLLGLTSVTSRASALTVLTVIYGGLIGGRLLDLTQSHGNGYGEIIVSLHFIDAIGFLTVIGLFLTRPRSRRS